jgi:hypothetical protein
MLKKLNLSGHENAQLAEMGFEFPGSLQVNLSDPQTPQKVADFLVSLGISSEDQILLVLPGLAPLAALVISIIHGLTGTFPVIQLMVKGDSGFVPGFTVDLNEVRTNARANRRGTIIM